MHARKHTYIYTHSDTWEKEKEVIGTTKTQGHKQRRSQPVVTHPIIHSNGRIYMVGMKWNWQDVREQRTRRFEFAVATFSSLGTFFKACWQLSGLLYRLPDHPSHTTTRLIVLFRVFHLFILPFLFNFFLFFHVFISLYYLNFYCSLHFSPHVLDLKKIPKSVWLHFVFSRACSYTKQRTRRRKSMSKVE